MKVKPHLSITSNSSILYFFYGTRSYAEEFNHLKLHYFVELKILNFIKFSQIFPISWTLDPDQNTLKNPCTKNIHPKFQCFIINNTSDNKSSVKVLVTEGQTDGRTNEF